MSRVLSWIFDAFRRDKHSADQSLRNAKCVQDRVDRADERLTDFPCQPVRQAARFVVERGGKVMSISNWGQDCIEVNVPLDAALKSELEERWPQLEYSYTAPAPHESGYRSVACPSCGRWIFFPLSRRWLIFGKGCRNRAICRAAVCTRLVKH
jgi:hypothetical protein